MKSQTNLRSRRLTLIALAAALIGGIGCATALVASGPNSNTTVKEGEIVLKDTILALGKPDVRMAQQMGNVTTVGFLGKSDTYLLVEGGATLLSLSQQLDPARLNLVEDNHKLYLRDRTIWGTLRFNYAGDKTASYTDEEKASLKNLKFVKSRDGSYYVDLAVKGAVYPAMDVKAAGFAPLQRSRNLVFHAPPTTESTPNFSKVAMLPVAIAVDVVTAPLQLLGLAVVGLSLLH